MFLQKVLLPKLEMPLLFHLKLLLIMQEMLDKKLLIGEDRLITLEIKVKRIIYSKMENG